MRVRGECVVIEAEKIQMWVNLVGPHASSAASQV